MKGLNIKKVAAIGIGAALIGSALAPVVLANQVPGGLSELEQSDIVDATGTPVVDIVVGSNAAVSDVVWAGNIAARVAQLATTSASGAAGAVTGATVDVTVGGQTVMSGAGYVEEANLNLAAAELGPISVNDVDVPYLINQTGVTLRWNGENQTGSVRESIYLASADARLQMQTGSTRFAVGELVSSVQRNAVEYEVDLGSGIPTGATILNMDSNSAYDVRIPFLGKTYVLNEINTTNNSIIMYSQTLPQKIYPTDVITVPGSGNYAGRDLTVELETVWITSADGQFNARWVLRDGSTIVNTREVVGTSYDLRDEFGSNIIGDSAFVSNVARDVVADRFFASIRTGADRLELRDGQGFPYTGEATVDADAQWHVELVGFSSNTLTAIKLRNNWGFTSTSTESEVVKNVLKVGDQIELPENYGVVRFMGLESKPMYEAHVGNNRVTFRPLEGVSQVNLPLHVGVQLDVNRPRVVNVSGQDYTFMLSDVGAVGVADKSLTYIRGSFAGETVTNALAWPNQVDVNRGVINNAVSLDVGARNAGAPVFYDFNVLLSDAPNDRSFLLLSAQNFDLYNKAKQGATLTFNGTIDVDSNDIDFPVYVPNTSEVIGAFTTSPVGAYSASNYWSARFAYNDLNNMDNVYMYLRADDSGNVWDFDSIKDESAKSNITLDASYAPWGGSAIRGGSDYLLAGHTADGSMVSSEGGKFVISYPDERRRVQMFIGSDDLQETVVGGQSFTGVAQGQTATQGGVSVTIDAVSGTAEGASGVAMVPTGNLVRTDAQSGKARQIIVGGYVVNAMARDLEVMNGNTLEDLLVSSGDYVAALLNSGKIVVAGYTAEDTASAARDLISALDALI